MWFALVKYVGEEEQAITERVEQSRAEGKLIWTCAIGRGGVHVCDMDKAHYLKISLVAYNDI